MKVIEDERWRLFTYTQLETLIKEFIKDMRYKNGNVIVSIGLQFIQKNGYSR
jgi:hypothetical protein